MAEVCVKQMPFIESRIYGKENVQAFVFVCMNPHPNTHPTNTKLITVLIISLIEYKYAI